MEHDFNNLIALARSKFANLSSIQPIKLPYNGNINSEHGDLPEEFTFEVQELNSMDYQKEDGVSALGKDVQNKNSNDLQALGNIFHYYMGELNKIDCKPIFKNRLSHRISEEITYLFLVNRYFKVIAYLYQVELRNNHLGKITWPLVSENKGMGLVVTPEEIQQLLSLEKLSYTDYLLSLLRFIDVIVEYTTETIILVSIGSEDATEVLNSQFSLCLINLQAITKLQNGFQMLDLKNDIIRRKYDGLKYNSKKLNGIVYDISLRKLIVNEVHIY